MSDGAVLEGYPVNDRPVFRVVDDGFDVLRAERCRVDERIGVLAAQVHALEAELVEQIARFDELEGWQDSDFRSMGDWLSIRTKFTVPDARRLVRVSKKLGVLPSLMGLAKQGQVSVGMLNVAARVSTADNEAAVARTVSRCTPAQATTVLNKYRHVKPKPDPDPDVVPEPEPVFWWRSWHDSLGRGRVDAAMDEVTFALLEKARDAARVAGEHEQPSGGDGQPERLSVNEVTGRLAELAMDQANQSGLRARGGEKFVVQLNVDVETLAQILGIEFDQTLPFRLGSECFLPDTGRHLSDAEAARFLCDAGIQVIVSHHGVPLWLGNKVEMFNRAQRRLMRSRAGGCGGCEFPGCGQTRFTEAHHVIFQSVDGTSDPTNGMFLCAFHHRQLHRLGWSVTTDGDQVFTFWDNEGRCLGTTTRGHEPGGRPPDLFGLPDLPDGRAPDPPAGFNGDTPKSDTRGERMTHYAFDVFLEQLLTA